MPKQIAHCVALVHFKMILEEQLAVCVHLERIRLVLVLTVPCHVYLAIAALSQMSQELATVLFAKSERIKTELVKHRASIVLQLQLHSTQVLSTYRNVFAILDILEWVPVHASNVRAIPLKIRRGMRIRASVVTQIVARMAQLVPLALLLVFAMLDITETVPRNVQFALLTLTNR